MADVLCRKYRYRAEKITTEDEVVEKMLEEMRTVVQGEYDKGN